MFQVLVGCSSFYTVPIAVIFRVRRRNGRMSFLPTKLYDRIRVFRKIFYD